MGNSCGANPFLTSEELWVRPAGEKYHSRSLKARIVDNEGKVLEDYFDLPKTAALGEGGYAEVRIGTNKFTGDQRAIKNILKSRLKEPTMLRDEVDIMQRLDHPNIVKLFQCFEDARAVYLVMELCAGGELFDRITAEGKLTEKDSAVIMQQILHAICYCHEVGVAHRDLKPENFLLLKKGPLAGNTLKVIDFGLARTFDPDTLGGGEADEAFSTKTGTAYYVAPEVLSSSHFGPQIDLWSCGIVMYILLTGKLPFSGTQEQVLSKVKKGKIKFPKEFWEGISTDAVDLIKNLTRMEPSERLTAQESLHHTWILHQAPQASHHPLQRSHVDNLLMFRGANKVKKTALLVAARYMKEEQLEELREVFNDLDTEGNGILSFAELRLGLQQVGTQDMDDALSALDEDDSGSVDYTEFLASTLARRQFAEESVAWAAFRVFDRDDDKRISLQELTMVLHETDAHLKVGHESVQQLMQEVDKNGDGYIDFDEFKALLQS